MTTPYKTVSRRIPSILWVFISSHQNVLMMRDTKQLLLSIHVIVTVIYTCILYEDVV